jgi:Na+-transporting NADH:ubiquinone oxidoreductase subunit C
MPRFDPDKNPAYVIFFAALISAAFTGAIMVLYVVTKPTVRRNEQLLTQRALVQIFDLGEPEQMADDEVVAVCEKQIRRKLLDGQDPKSPLSYRYFAFKPDAQPGDAPYAAAFPIDGIGYWAYIGGLLAFEVDSLRALGVTFLQQAETPGLGARITEAEFRTQWKGLDLTPPPAGEKFIYITKTPTADIPKSSPQFGRHVDTITGATHTSNAVQRFVNDDLAAKLAEVRAEARTFTYTEEAPHAGSR